jgi:beta-glucanase (GH16 family)
MNHVVGQVVCHGKHVLLSETAVCNKNSFVLAFEENFDSDSLDLGKWSPATGVIRDFKHTIARQWFTPKNIEISNGILKLHSRRENLINKCFYTGKDSVCEDFLFSTAQIDSREKFGYGKFEISCKIAKGRGVASSFWTYGEEMNEIDIFEFDNEKNILNRVDEEKSVKTHKMNAHADYDGDERSEDCPNHYKGPDYSLEFHVFTLVWAPHKIEWFVDGVKKRSNYLFYTMLGQPLECHELRAGTQYILDRSFPRHPMNIIVDNIIQTGKEAPGDNVAFPVLYEIDWIRYYKPEP